MSGVDPLQRETRIAVRARDAREAFLGDLPLDPDLPQPIVVDASDVVDCHPMFALRLRMFVDWHRAAGKGVTVIAPATVVPLAIWPTSTSGPVSGRRTRR